MRIVAWNLGHQTKERLIRDGFAKAIAQLKPDVLTLNEYVHGPSRTKLLVSLTEIGLSHILVSERIGSHNQVLIASRTRIISGQLKAPSISAADNSNFLHIRLPNENLDVVGMRVPAYKENEKKAAYWREFFQIAASVALQRVVFIGDLNVNPMSSRYVGSRYLNQLVESGWQLPSPKGPWSYISKTGANSRIDHALVSSALKVTAISYVTGVGGIKLAGADDDAFSDHAALVADFQI